MRKTIRLTGRKQLPQSHFAVTIDSHDASPKVRLDLKDSWNASAFPRDAEIRVKLVENKFVEVVCLGTVGHPKKEAHLSSKIFRAPSCQIRIVSRTPKNEGLLLGSTKAWTLRAQGQPEGILFFQAADIHPRLWKLDLRPQEHPILYIDERVPNAALWARSDPIFVASVLPQVAAIVLAAILEAGDVSDEGWESDWIQWTEALVPGNKPPFSGDADDKARWV